MNNITLKLPIETATRLKKFISIALVSMVALLFVAPAYAEDFWFGGRLKAGTGTHFDRLDDSSGQGPAQFVLELQAEWSP
jgi:hypothetical protein